MGEQPQTVWLACAEWGQYSDHETAILGVYGNKAAAVEALLALRSDVSRMTADRMECEYESQAEVAKRWGTDEFDWTSDYDLETYVLETTIARVFTPGVLKVM